MIVMRLIVLLLPFAAGPAQAQLSPEGCWVSFFAGRDFKVPTARLAGRSFVESFATEIPGAVKPELAHVGGEAFFRDVSSIVVGPQARLVGYAERNFRGRELVLKAGQRANLELAERVRSFKIFCEPT